MKHFFTVLSRAYTSNFWRVTSSVLTTTRSTLQDITEERGSRPRSQKIREINFFFETFVQDKIFKKYFLRRQKIYIYTLTLSLQHTVYVRDSSYISNRNFNAFSNNSRQFKITAEKLQPKIESYLKKKSNAVWIFLSQAIFLEYIFRPEWCCITYVKIITRIFL